MRYLLSKQKFWISVLFLSILSLAPNAYAQTYISTAAEWNACANKMNGQNQSGALRKATYVLTADLDFSGINFIPFGPYKQGSKYTGGSSADSYWFAGTLEGNGHTLKNITKFPYSISDATEYYYAVVTCIKGDAVIRNLKVDGMQIPTSSNAKHAIASAGIVGNAMSGTIENCAVLNSYLYGNAGPIGGIAGTDGGVSLKNCIVNNCTFDNPASELGVVGGIVGDFTGVDIDIENCYVNAAFNHVQSFTGGIAGRIFSSASGEVKMVNCYATGTFDFSTAAGDSKDAASSDGGLVGYAKYLRMQDCGSSIVTTLNLGSFNGTKSLQNLAGAIGYVDQNNKIANVYATGELNYKGTISNNLMAGINSFYGRISEYTDIYGIKHFYDFEVPSTCYSEKESYDRLVKLGYDKSSGDIVYGAPATLLDSSFMRSGCLAQQMNNDEGNTTRDKAVWIWRDGCFNNYPVPFGQVPSMLDSMLAVGIITDADRSALSKLPTCGDVQTIFHIKTADELAALASEVASSEDGCEGKTYIIDNDIDGVTSVIGTSDKPFQGTFNGGGYTIKVNITGTSDNVGLIGVAGASANILNVQVVGSVSGGSNVGAVVGSAAAGSSISNCANGAVVSGTSNVGGIVGSSAGSVSGCVNVADVNGTSNVGGIAGSAASLSDCANMGYVNGSTLTSTAGIAGSATGTLTQCYSAGYTLGASVSNGGTAKSCYCEPALTITEQSGVTKVTMTATTNTSITGWESKVGCYPVPTAVANTTIGKLAANALYFVSGSKANALVDSIRADASVWANSNSSVLKYNKSAFLPIASGSTTLSITSDGITRNIPITVKDPGLFSGGFGNALSHFKISKNEDLMGMMGYIRDGNSTVGKYFELINDITDGPLTTNISNSTNHFEGNFFSTEGHVYNIPVDFVFDGGYPFALISVNNGVVERISVTGQVVNKSNSSEAYAAGVVGNNVGKVIDCVNNAAVTCKSAAGGVCGISSGTVSGCTNIGVVTGATAAAGITTVKEATAVVSNCFNGGVITGSTAAGIAAITSNLSSVNPSFSNNVNVGAVNGSAKSDALIYVNATSPTISGGVYDTQHSVASSSNGTATANVTADLTSATISGWTNGSNLYPQYSSFAIAKIASAPVFLNAIDSAANVKHDFKVETSTGVTWKSTQNLVSIKGGSVQRVAAGKDTLVATLGNYTRLVPITIVCAWDTVKADPVEVCNFYGGNKYDVATTLTVSDTTIGSIPNSDCGTITIKTINVRVGAEGKNVDTIACGSFTYDNVTYIKDTTFSDSNCNIISVKVYPTAKVEDSIITAPCATDTFRFTANGKSYAIARTSKPIVDSLIATKVYKSSICSCDSLIRNVKVSIPSFVTDSVVSKVQCSVFKYRTFAGKDTLFGWNWDNYNPNEWYKGNMTYTITYADTNFVAGSKDFTEIRNLTVSIYRTKYGTEYYDSDDETGLCNPEPYLAYGDRKIIITKDTTFLDSVPSTTLEGCPSDISKITYHVKGVSDTLAPIYIGALGAERCDTCAKVIILENVKGDEYANVGFCDRVKYKKNASDSRTSTRISSGDTYVRYSSDESCGHTVPYRFSINQSSYVDSTLDSCEHVTYITKSGETKVFTESTTYNDTISGAVPGCGCDSIWRVRIVVHNPSDSVLNVVECESYTFEYMNTAKGSLNVVKDTVIFDTLPNYLGCDSIIRTTNVTIHKSYKPEDNVLVEKAACQSFIYKSPIKGYIACKVDTMFNDTLTTQYGCDSIIPVKITINQPAVIDSVINNCSEFRYRYHMDGMGSIVISIPDDPDYLERDTINDVYTNVDSTLCDTVVRIIVISHPTRVSKSTSSVCDSREYYTRFDGTSFLIDKSMKVYDTLKSKMCDCDSIIRIDSFTVGTPYYPTESTELATTLYGCRFDGDLTYVRAANDWNEARSITFKPVSSESPNQKDFLDKVRLSNPTVVKLDTVRETLPTGRTWVRYYWLAHDTMKTVLGCDSVVPFHVEYDGQHTLGRHYYYVNYSYVPFTYQDVTYNWPSEWGNNWQKTTHSIVNKDSVEIVLPSTTGGCDTSYYAWIKLYPCRIDTVKQHFCDLASFVDLHNRTITFDHDAVYSDTVRYFIPAADTARCDSAIRTWIVTVGQTTPVESIDTVYIGGCDAVTFTRNGDATNMDAQDTTFTSSSVFRCHYINKTGCDSVVTVNATVHKTEPTTVIVRRTDYYQFKSLIDKSIQRITSDTSITEQVPDMVKVTMPNGESFTCDSIITSRIIIRPAEWRDTLIQDCDSVYAIASTNDSIRGKFNEQKKIWYKSNTKFDMPNSDTYDPYYHVTIKVNKSAHTHKTIDGCEEAVYNDRVYKKDTILVEPFSTVNGCDSIDTVHIVVHPVIYNEENYDGCSYVRYEHEVLTSSDVRYDTIRSKSCGCDSVITAININVFKPKMTERLIDSCMFLTYPTIKAKEFNWLVRDTVYGLTKVDSVYTTTQSFYQYLTDDYDENGCATIEHTTLQVDPCYPYPVIINKYNWILALNKDLLYKDVNSRRITGYQWYKNGELIKSANQSYFTEDKRLEGCYQVHVLYGSLDLASEEVCIDPSVEVALDYDVYPDPVNLGDKVSIKCNFTDDEAVAEIYNMLGVKVYRGTIDITENVSMELPYALGSAGNYFLKLTTSKGTVLGKKFIVR